MTPEALPPDLPVIARKPRNWISAFALCCAMLAFALALTPDALRRWYPDPSRPVGQVVRDSLGELKTGIGGLLSDANDVRPDAPPLPISNFERAEIAADLLAIASILLAATSFVRREPDRSIAASIALSAASLAYGLQVKALCALAAGLAVLFLLSKRS